ncbi:uncharacterized protein FIBRA_06863 [Fibroporia radiculosa]|uniref:IMD domain-containing protein n=1 Tax=Fibroporia radiculosa TaxID=599839 RepID=J4HZS2_9APHY|nr:uncharacterized protein FIBRA_06863 [Fibroporia radiculosa]CCM04677.1 predicted protein [Fibroporia radiculosa]
MSVPTQVLPSWLTLSTTVITAPNGRVSTSSTTLRLPLTYYGPSIPLGTNGVWTWGGLTPPPSTTSASTSSTLATTSSVSTTLSPTSSVFSSSQTSTSTTAPATSAPVAGTAGATSHGLSATKLGAILGAVLGTVFLVILILIILLLWRSYRRGRQSRPPTDQSSSFWNRRTTLFSIQRQSRRQTPIWTEWQMVSPDDFNDDANIGVQSPGEGSPRGSGEEDDPFLTRSLRSTADEMSQTKTGTDTLVSMPAAAAIAGGTVSTHRSGTKVGGPIMPRNELLSRMIEEEAAMPTVRVVNASPEDHTMPLPPPPPIGFVQRSFRPARSSQSIGSIGVSEKSIASIPESPGPEAAEFLTARRVKLGLEPGEGEPGPSLWTGGPSGLERLANLPRMSWFRRMSFLSPRGSRDAPTPVAAAATDDRYTRTPPRAHSRQGSRSSRPVSWAPLPTQEPSSPTSSTGRRPRSQSGLRAELGMREERPISTLSSRSRTTTASGNTMYHDARSTPGSSMVDVTSPVGTFGSGGSRVPPVPPLPAPQRRQASQTRSTSDGEYESVPREPPSYEASMLPPTRLGNTPTSELDVLDEPAPRPASPFTAVSGRPNIPPGLVPLPTPDAWRNSRVTDMSMDTSGIQIDVLEDEPPAARDGWRSLASGGEGRRMTFGVPMVVHPRDALNSEQGSLHSMRSHLSPRSGLSPAGSAPASSRHTMHSSSSRPSMHSQGLTGSSGMSLTHSSSLSDDDRRPRRHAGVGEVGSPPVSAVFSREGPWESRPRSPLAHAPGMPHLPPIRQSPSSSNAEIPPPYIASGTLTSVVTTRTEDTHTNSSVTTTLTDPITGAVLHFPALPWGGIQDNRWENARHNDNEMWSDVHKSCKTLEAVVNVLNDYCEAENAIITLQKKLAKALRDAASVKCVAEIPATALVTGATIFETLSDVNQKFVRLADKECDGISAEVKKWFKKLAKEEKAHDARIASANAKIRQAGELYEKKSRKYPQEAADEHTRYINVLSTLGPEINQDKYNHALLITQRHNNVMHILAACLSRVADGEWLRSCEGVRRFSPTIGPLGEIRAYCEGGWSGAMPSGLPETLQSTASLDRSNTPMSMSRAATPNGQDSYALTVPPSSKPAPDYSSRQGSEQTQDSSSLAATPSGDSPSAPPQYMTIPSEPPANGQAHNLLSRALADQRNRSNTSLTSLASFPSPPTHFPLPPVAVKEPSSPIMDKKDESSSSRRRSSDVPFPRHTESPVPLSPDEQAIVDASRSASEQALIQSMSTTFSETSNTSMRKGQDNTSSEIQGKAASEHSSAHSPAPEMIRSPVDHLTPTNSGMSMRPASRRLESPGQENKVTSGDLLVKNPTIEQTTQPGVTGGSSPIIERADTGKSTISVVATLRDRYTRQAEPPSPPRKEVPRVPTSVSHLTNKYESSRTPPSSPTSSRHAPASDDRRRVSVDMTRRTSQVPIPERVSPSTSHGRYSIAGSPSMPSSDELVLRRRRVEELEVLELREQELELRRKEREIEVRAKELELERGRLLNARGLDSGYGSDSERLGIVDRLSHRPQLHLPSVSPTASRPRHALHSYSTTNVALPPSQQAPTDYPSSQPSSPLHPADHGPYCTCEACSIPRYASRDVRSGQGSSNVRPEKPKGWIRRLSMPVMSNAFSLDSKKNISSVGIAGGPGTRNSFVLPEEDGMLRRDATGGIRNRSTTNLARR